MPSEEEDAFDARMRPSVRMGINMCEDLTTTPHSWRVELFSEVDYGSCWSVFHCATRKEMIEKAERFAWFTGLPLSYEGDEWVI